MFIYYAKLCNLLSGNIYLVNYFSKCSTYRNLFQINVSNFKAFYILFPLYISFPGGAMRRGREADHSPPNIAEVKKTWIYKSTPPYAFMA
jgi:hypothetical protein